MRPLTDAKRLSDCLMALRVLDRDVYIGPAYQWAGRCAGRTTEGREMIVAALFVQPDGCYAFDDRFDAWPESRDARKYDGALPVIAHPPCQRWGALAAVNFKRYGGEHNRPGNDGGCFSSALNSVRKNGCVLEHPKNSKAFSAYGIKKPSGIGWNFLECGGYVCEVWQSAYGHRANKATWLYYYGKNKPKELLWIRPKGTHQVGFQDHRGKERNKPTLSKREANATPKAFMEERSR